MFRRLVDFFIPTKIRNSGADLRNERIFVSVLLVAAIADFLGIGLTEELRLRVVTYLLITNSCICFILLAGYKNGLAKFVAAHVFLAQHCISFAVQAWYQGGLVTPATAAYFLLPALAILILGRRPAIFWLIVTVILTSSYYVYETIYGPTDILYDPTKRAYLFFSSILATNISVFIILLINENSKNKALALARQRLDELTAAQSQLVQSEKMASLGELTAGIAHEIQNPLNFVNNFSEVNTELISELEKAASEGNLIEVKSIVKDLKENEEKITHHGKRADGIVKGMLQHSRRGTGQKKLTDINALCDEYLRLSYHGLRAKNKSFNAKFETHLDPTLPKLNVVPQDIGRVILNLINNAFYAVNEKYIVESQKFATSYEPVVSITTIHSLSSGEGLGEVIIKVKDNGNGIPENIKDKIFQPFFTTKPTGQGTGLGLSLAYDIVKTHGGELRATTKEGGGTEFTVMLPVG